ncbi:double-strand break repair protein AddB [Brevundimonas bacteroides]|uniref:double-strand break repair protein AddB n=1 Tax=Brevundimonas bacteroides TaxID=74311 RepID=UPI0004980810|nr:double-strand break repair protein AddB [Brevundimonas bacteroides]
MTSRFDPFADKGPRWFAVPAHRPFLEDLAAGVLDWLGDRPPETLSDAVILLPNRRAARAFGAALATQSGGRPVLLPQVRPLGDLEEDEPPFSPGELGLDLPPAIAPLTRRFEMARMIVEDHLPGHPPLRALELADALGRFLDSCHIEEVEAPERVATLAPDDLAEHWQASAEFLGLAVEAWPKRLEAMGLVDASWRRTRLLRLLAERWAKTPPIGPVIAAGSTGTVKAAADVLKAVANAPQGCVVLPGLDHDLAETAWAEVDEPHPQGALKRLLERAEIERAAVRPWFRPAIAPADEAKGRARARLLNEALRPADATADWRTEIADLRARAAASGQSADPVALGLDGLSVVACRAEEEAAQTIALLMRETLETPGKTCALVTPDLALGRRVAARLERWGIVADSSSGATLERMSVGTLVDLAARFIADPLNPQTLLGLLKADAIAVPEASRTAVRTLEKSALRGPSPRRWSRIADRLKQAGQPRGAGGAVSDHNLAALAEATALAEHLHLLAEAAHTSFAPEAPLDDAARALTALIESLCGADVWSGPDGEAAAALLAHLIEGGSALGPIGRDAFAELGHVLLRETTVRTGGATHPSLRILGAIEARLVRADRMILAGLEETVWPAAAPTDPFLSRPMRKALGLPPPERRVGQTAQDFVQAASSPEAILIHRERLGGQPAVQSRWLWRLQMLTGGATDNHNTVRIDAACPALDIARALDAPVGPARLAPRPAPRPPVERRPRKLPVTAIERWARDPYSVYARYVLGLREMDRPGQSADALLRGQALHKAVERFVADWPDALPDDTEARLFALLTEALTEHGFEDAAMAREVPLARNAARWLAGFELRRRARGIVIRVEEEVAHPIPTPHGPFIVTAKADRIEISATGASILDFKTGQAPSNKEVASGLAPQLTLTGAILAEAGLDGIGPVEAEDLTYIRIIGRTVAGATRTIASGAEAAELSRQALERLTRAVRAFDNPDIPYSSWTRPQKKASFGGRYDRLARVWEWSVIGGDEGEE